LKRSRMRRLRARFAPVASGRPGLTVRANYVALPFAGWTRCWMKAGESLPDQGLSFSPVLTRKYGPRLTNRRQWSAVRRCAFGRSSPRTRCRKRNKHKVRLAALHAPRIEGANEAGLARAVRGTTKSSPRAIEARERMRTPSLARMGQAPHAHAV
jgi:hypothetical protein